MARALWFIFDMPAAMSGKVTTMLARGRRAEAVEDCLQRLESLSGTCDNLVRVALASDLLLSPDGILLEGGASEAQKPVGLQEYFHLWDSIEKWLDQVDRSDKYADALCERIAMVLREGRAAAEERLGLGG